MGNNVVIRDGNRVPVGLAPCGIRTIQADTPIKWRFLVPESGDMQVYYTDAPTEIGTVRVDRAIGVHENLRLVATCRCWVF